MGVVADRRGRTGHSARADRDARVRHVRRRRGRRGRHRGARRRRRRPGPRLRRRSRSRCIAVVRPDRGPAPRPAAPSSRSGIDALKGRQAVVLERVDGARRPDQARRRDLVRPLARRRPGLRAGPAGRRRRDRRSHRRRHVTSTVRKLSRTPPRGRRRVCQTRPARSSTSIRSSGIAGSEGHGEHDATDHHRPDHSGGAGLHRPDQDDPGHPAGQRRHRRALRPLHPHPQRGPQHRRPVHRLDPQPHRPARTGRARSRRSR